MCTRIDAYIHIYIYIDRYVLIYTYRYYTMLYNQGYGCHLSATNHFEILREVYGFNDMCVCVCLFLRIAKYYTPEIKSWDAIGKCH